MAGGSVPIRQASEIDQDILTFGIERYATRVTNIPQPNDLASAVVDGANARDLR